VVEHVAIIPIRFVATATAASTVTGLSQVRAAWATSSPSASWSARKMESNSAPSARCGQILVVADIGQASGEAAGCRHDASWWPRL